MLQGNEILSLVTRLGSNFPYKNTCDLCKGSSSIIAWGLSRWGLSRYGKGEFYCLNCLIDSIISLKQVNLQQKYFDHHPRMFCSDVVGSSGLILRAQGSFERDNISLCFSCFSRISQEDWELVFTTNALLQEEVR